MFDQNWQQQRERERLQREQQLEAVRRREQRERNMQTLQDLLKRKERDLTIRLPPAVRSEWWSGVIGKLLGKKKRPVGRLDGFQHGVTEKLLDQGFVHAVAHHDQIGVDIPGKG